MNRLTPRLLCSLVALVLLPISGFGQMSTATADRLRQSIDALDAKILDLQNPNFPPHLHQGPYDAHAVTVNASFLQNLKQLRTNLVSIWCAANTRDGHLNVATIALYLHTNLQQSAFTDTAGAHAAGVLPAAAPASSFTVRSGRSSFTFPVPNLQRRFNNDFLIVLPVHDSIQLVPNPLHPAHPIPLNIGDPDVVLAVAIQPPQPFIEEALRYNSMNFSGAIRVRPLYPGEILVRCCQSDPAQQQARKEPGTWWVDVADMPLSVSDIRSGLAIRPDWNQDGNLEFFVVPEGCNITVLEGLASSQRLVKDDHRFVKLLANTHYPNFHPQLNFVDGQYLIGGTNQIAIVGNFGDVYGNGIICPGFAFYQTNHPGGPNGYMPCIAIVETGFDVEL